MIELEIVPYLPLPKRGFKSKAPLCEIVNAILYKLKQGFNGNIYLLKRNPPPNCTPLKKGIILVSCFPVFRKKLLEKINKRYLVRNIFFE
nr:hypothetical protein [uncultured Polaribacter sp.]